MNGDEVFDPGMLGDEQLAAFLVGAQHLKDGTPADKPARPEVCICGEHGGAEHPAGSSEQQRLRIDQAAETASATLGVLLAVVIPDCVANVKRLFGLGPEDEAVLVEVLSRTLFAKLEPHIVTRLLAVAALKLLDAGLAPTALEAQQALKLAHMRWGREGQTPPPDFFAS